MGKKLFLFAAAAVALASCTETDLSGDTSFAKESTSDAIQFSAKAGNAGTTRAGVVGTQTTSSLKGGVTSAGTGHVGTGFGVMGYQTAANLTIPLGADMTPNFMYNQQITWATTADYWTYSPVKYWPNGTDDAAKTVDKANADNSPSNTAISTNTDKLSFFAYAPWVNVVDDDYTSTKIVTGKKLGGDATGKDIFYAVDNTESAIDDGIVAFTANTVEADPQVFYYMSKADVNQAVDLLWGLRGSKQYMETDGSNNPADALTNLGNSYNINLTKQDVPETVNFLFKHALSKIGGNTKSTSSTTGQQKCGLKVVLDVDANGNGLSGVDNQSLYLGSEFAPSSTLVTIKSVAVQDGASAWAQRASQTDPDKNALPDSPQLYSNLMNSGWFDLATGAWSDVTIVDNKGAKKTPENTAPGSTYNITADRTGTDGYKINPEIVEPESDPAVDGTDKTKWATGSNIPTGVIVSEAKNVYSNETDVPSLLMIPNGTKEQTLYVTVDYVVRTADPKLSTGYSEVEQIVTNKVSLKGLDVNKYYTLVMHLGLTSVKFSAIVANWAETDNATYDEDGTHEGSATSTEVVWLPSNVVAQSTGTTAPLGTASNVNVAAKTTSYTITTTGLAEGQSITATFAAPIKSVTIGGTPLTSGTLEGLDATEAAGPIVVGLDANTKVKAVKNLLTLVQKDNDGNELSTTTVNIVQSAFDIVLSEDSENKGKIVFVKDGDNQNVAAAKYSVVVVDSEGKTVAAENYTQADGSVTMNDAGVYTVTVTYSDGSNPAISRSIDIRP